MNALILIWLISGSIGFAITAINLHDSWCDYAAIRKANINSLKRILAFRYARNDFIKCLVLFAFIMIGIGTLLDWPRWGAIIIFEAVPILISLSSILNRFDKRKIE